jgi:predicted GNAT family acetyltransferase
VQARQIADATEFLARAGPLLVADEARHNLLLGLAGTLRDDPAAYPEHRLWVVEDAGAVVGAALRTPPHSLVRARPLRDGALDALAAAIDDDLPGVVGAQPEAGAFADVWAARTGAAATVRFAQGIHRLERVRPAAAPGALRDATDGDLPLLLDWWRAFAVEAHGGAPPPDDEIRHALAHRGGLVIWDDGGPVSFAGHGGETPNGVRIGPVYTPPERRGRGYASALVAALSARLLAGGRRFCFLYTDHANPTANRIYARIGYERVCDAAEIAFARDAPAP